MSAALYGDGRISCDQTGIRIGWDHLWGAKRIRYASVKAVENLPLTGANKVRRWRIWGSGDFVHWWNLDPGRIHKNMALVLEGDRSQSGSSGVPVVSGRGALPLTWLSESDVLVITRRGFDGGGHAMPKTIKGNAGRKPPEPAANHSIIEDWFRRQMPHLQPIVKQLDETIRATIPGLQYAVKWKRPYYGLPELGWIIEMAAYDVSVNVVFLGGADFSSPPPLGTTDRSRYIKVTTVEEVQGPELRKWIREASRTPGWR